MCVGNTRSIFKTLPVRNDGTRGKAFPPCPPRPLPACALPAASIHHVLCSTAQASPGTGCSAHVLCNSHPALSRAPDPVVLGQESGLEWSGACSGVWLELSSAWLLQSPDALRFWPKDVTPRVGSVTLGCP